MTRIHVAMAIALLSTATYPSDVWAAEPSPASEAADSQSTSGRALLGLQYQMTDGDTHPTVMTVGPGGPAANAGIEPGDQIIAVAGEALAVNNSLEVAKFLTRFQPGEEVDVRVARGAQQLNLRLTFGTMPGAQERALNQRMRVAEERLAAGLPCDDCAPVPRFLDLVPQWSDGSSVRIDVTRTDTGFLAQGKNGAINEPLVPSDMPEALLHRVNDLEVGESLALSVLQEGKRTTIDLAED